MTNPASMLLESMRLGWATARLMSEAQAVMALRLSGMAGLWVLPPGETKRMVSEKPMAFADAWLKGTMAMAHGASSATALGASLRPLQRKTSANRRRLTKRRLG